MKHIAFTSTSSVLITLALMLALGCSHDRNAEKELYFNSGTRNFDARNYRRAALQFSRALHADPLFAQAHFHLGRTYLRLGAWSDAYTELHRAVELMPQNTKARISLGDLLLAAHRTEETQEQVNAILQREPDNPDAHALQANLFAANRDMGKAIVEIRKSIARAPARVDFYESLAVLQMDSDEPWEAVPTLGQAIRVDPEAFLPHVLLGSYYRRRQQWDAAEAQFRTAIHMAPDHLGPRRALADMYLEQKSREQGRHPTGGSADKVVAVPQLRTLLADIDVRTAALARSAAELIALLRLHRNKSDSRITPSGGGENLTAAPDIYNALLVIQGSPAEYGNLSPSTSESGNIAMSLEGFEEVMFLVLFGVLAAVGAGVMHKTWRGTSHRC